MEHRIKLYFKAINGLPGMFYKESIMIQSRSIDINSGVN